MRGFESSGGGRSRLARLPSIFLDFVRAEAAGGVLLLACTVAALAWANSRWAGSYFALWHAKLTVGAGPFLLSKPLLLWINDGLMAVFFFVVGLEIKREALAGELASARRAALPIAAAVGGMLVPAAIYAAVNAGGPGAAGWGIPMATDIAFALGVLTLAGPAVPLGLKVFLTALAIVDDIGAVLVIALFYSHGISWGSLGAGGAFLAALVMLNRCGARHPLLYVAPGVGLWLAFLLSGVHPTVAGVLAAMAIPAGTRIDSGQFLERCRELLERFQEAGGRSGAPLPGPGRADAVHSLERACEEVQTPLQRLEHLLHPWVTYAIMPLFALANAGVGLEGGVSSGLAHPVALGVALGLVAGKPIGITLFSWLAVRAGVAALPEGVGWRQIYGAAWLGGIGFTMSLFIAGLAFGEGELLPVAKLAILCASLVSGVVGWGLLRGAGRTGDASA